MSTQRPLTGAHVLAALLSFFALIIAANAAFLYFAVKTFPGEKERKSYRQGLLFNEVLDARAQQDTLGWRAAIESVARDGNAVTLVVSFEDKNAVPLEGLDLKGALTRPASEEGDQLVAFAPSGVGRYRAAIIATGGAWDLTVTASSGSEEEFQFTNRVILP